MTRIAVCLLAVASLSAGAGKQTFTGVITDSMCATGSHSAMRMGDTDAECTAACIDAHGATYVLASGSRVYDLSDQRTPARFAGQRVRVVGSLDNKAKMIVVDSISAASSARP